MNNKSRAVLWMCFTVLIAAGMKYVPSYLVQERQLDIQERALDLREDAFLHQKVAPTVSTSPEAVTAQTGQLL
jgi:hypothetical protein